MVAQEMNDIQVVQEEEAHKIQVEEVEEPALKKQKLEEVATSPSTGESDEEKPKEEAAKEEAGEESPAESPEEEGSPEEIESPKEEEIESPKEEEIESPKEDEIESPKEAAEVESPKEEAAAVVDEFAALKAVDREATKLEFNFEQEPEKLKFEAEIVQVNDEYVILKETKEEGPLMFTIEFLQEDAIEVLIKGAMGLEKTKADFSDDEYAAILSQAVAPLMEKGKKLMVQVDGPGLILDQSLKARVSEMK